MPVRREGATFICLFILACFVFRVRENIIVLRRLLPASAQETFLFQPPSCSWDYRQSTHHHTRDNDRIENEIISVHRESTICFIVITEAESAMNLVLSPASEYSVWLRLDKGRPVLIWKEVLPQPSDSEAAASPAPRQQPPSAPNWLHSTLWASGECMVRTSRGKWNFNVSQILATQRACDHCGFRNKFPQILKTYNMGLEQWLIH